MSPSLIALLSGRTLTPVLVLLLTGVAWMGCSSQSRLSQREDAVAGFHRLIEPFVIEDSSGRSYQEAFLGGLNVPRPQFVDIDADQDLDLFLQEMPGRVAFFENTGSPQEAEFEWRTDSFQNLAVGDWYRFVDMDGDQDYDLLTERQYGLIRYFKNSGTAEKPDFVLAEDSLRDVNGQPIFSDRQNNPNVADIDCDGMPDLFIGRLEGTVTRYELDRIDESGIPRFRHVADRFEGIEIIAQFGSLHGANGLSFYDVDDDGDLDFFWGDFFEAGLLFIENRGSCAEPDLRAEPLRFPVGAPISTSGYNVPTFADIDGDGHKDLFVAVLGGAFDPNRTSADNFYHLPNRGDNTFRTKTERYLYTFDIGTESFPSVADLDADGDLDVLVANKIDPYDGVRAHVYTLENIGSAAQARLRFSGRLDLSPAYHYAPEFADLDADGDLDLLLGTWNKGISYYRNEGSATQHRFELVEESFVTLTRGSNTTPTVGDIDGDGDLDLFSGESSGTINFYRNAGTPQNPVFDLVSDRFQEIDVGRRSVPVLVDLDTDEDLDLAIGSETGEVWIYRNVGNRTDPIFEADSSATIRLDVFATPEFADLDGDGDFDIISGGAGGGLMYLRQD